MNLKIRQAAVATGLHEIVLEIRENNIWNPEPDLMIAKHFKIKDRGGSRFEPVFESAKNENLAFPIFVNQNHVWLNQLPIESFYVDIHNQTFTCTLPDDAR